MPDLSKLSIADLVALRNHWGFLRNMQVYPEKSDETDKKRLLFLNDVEDEIEKRMDEFSKNYKVD